MDSIAKAISDIIELLDLIKYPEIGPTSVKTITIDLPIGDEEGDKKVKEFVRQLEVMNITMSEGRKLEISNNLVKSIQARIEKNDNLIQYYSQPSDDIIYVKSVGSLTSHLFAVSDLIKMCKASNENLSYLKQEVKKYTLLSECHAEVKLEKMEEEKEQNQLSKQKNSGFDFRYIEHLEKAEKGAEKCVSNWKQGVNGVKVECAAFCELVLEKKWLGNGKNRRKMILDFAAVRYGIDLGAAVEKSSKKGRDVHKERLKRHFL